MAHTTTLNYFHMNIYWHSWFGKIITTFGYLEVSFVENSFIVLWTSWKEPAPEITLHFDSTFTFFSIIHPTRSQFLRRQKIALLLNFHLFIPPHPNQFKYWNNFVIMFDSHFSNHSSHPIPPKKKTKIFIITFLLFGTEVLICQTNLRVVGRGLGWQTVGLIPPMFNLNDHPTQIPPSEILGPVVQNCQILHIFP